MVQDYAILMATSLDNEQCQSRNIGHIDSHQAQINSPHYLQCGCWRWGPLEQQFLDCKLYGVKLVNVLTNFVIVTEIHNDVYKQVHICLRRQPPLAVDQLLF